MEAEETAAFVCWYRLSSAGDTLRVVRAALSNPSLAVAEVSSTLDERVLPRKDPSQPSCLFFCFSSFKSVISPYICSQRRDSFVLPRSRELRISTCLRRGATKGTVNAQSSIHHHASIDERLPYRWPIHERLGQQVACIPTSCTNNPNSISRRDRSISHLRPFLPTRRVWQPRQHLKNIQPGIPFCLYFYCLSILNSKLIIYYSICNEGILQYKALMSPRYQHETSRQQQQKQR